MSDLLLKTLNVAMLIQMGVAKPTAVNFAKFYDFGQYNFSVPSFPHH